MFADLRALAQLAQSEEPRRRATILLLITAWVAAQWCSLFMVMRGLAMQRSGQLPIGELLLFLVYQAFYWQALRAADWRVGHWSTESARGSVERIAGRLHRLPLLEFEKLGRGALMTKLLGDGNRVALLNRPVLQVLTGGLHLLVAFAFIAYLSASAAVVAAEMCVLVVAITMTQFALRSKRFAEVARTEAELFDVLHDQRLGASPIRLHTLRANSIARHYRELSRRLHARRVEIWSRYFDRQYAFDALLYALLGVNIFILPLFVPITGETLRQVNLAVLFLLMAAVQLVFAFPAMSEGIQAAKRLRALGELLDENRLEPADHAVGRGRFADFTKLSIENITFRHARRGDRPGFALGPVSIAFERGEVLFVTGRNGSGKSTFLKLLCGLYAATSGRILVDGEPLTEADLPHLRALFSTIFVDHHLFAQVVDGDEPETADRARVLLAEMGLTGKTAFEDGRFTRLDLSTGQAKRLAMVMARLRDRPILLIDEWAADQAPEFRAFFYRKLLPTLREAGKLVIVVTHDDQHFGLADRRIEFDRGGAVLLPEVGE